MKRLFFSLLVVGSVLGAPIVFHDDGRVTGYVRSANTPDYFNRSGSMIVSGKRVDGVTNYVALPEGWGWPARWKLDGTNLVAWTQAEVDAEAAAAVTAAESAFRTAAKEPMSAIIPEAVALRATVKVLVAEINTLRQELNQAKTNLTTWTNAPVLANRTLGQAKAAILGVIEDKSAD